MNPDQKNTETPPPNEPWANLAFMMGRYCVTPTADVDACRDFLKAGEKVELPMVINVEGNKTPYRLFPNACYSIINSCIKVLEKSLENELNGGARDPEENKALTGIMCLADMLFDGTCTSPDGKFTIHWVREDTKKITINPHGRRIKQLVVRLEKYRTARIEMAKQRGEKLELPALSCKMTVEQEIRSSFAQWKTIDPTNWDGKKPWEIVDSLDSMKENMGYEASESTIGGFGDGFEDNAEIHDEEIAQAEWMGIDPGSIGESLRFSDTQRGNILARTPKAWLWSFNEDPLEFAVNYVSVNAKPCLEEAHGLLNKGRDTPSLQEAGSLALVLDAAGRNNPDNFWKIIKRIAGHFDTSRGNDPEALLQKLDCARFTVCLQSTNQKQGVDPNEFQRAFKEKVHQVLGDAKRRENITRNELLLETLGECAGSKSWNVQKKEQWLENLQSSAVGAYENSIGMENERKRLLAKLNHLFKTPREELERTHNSPDERGKVAEKLHTLLNSASDAFYIYLSGKTGQMTRRELRTKVHSLKTQAEKRGQHELVERLADTAKFISSISSQVKSGEWYEKKPENTQRIFSFLATMLECPKTEALEFPGSVEPEPKDPLEITCDFLRTMQGKETFLGGNTLKESLEDAKEFEMAHDGGRLTAALKRITKSTKERGRGVRQSLTGMIQDRRQTLEQAINIAEAVHGTPDPIRRIHGLIEEQIEILRAPQTLDAQANEQFRENLYFWKGIHYLAQNIQSRKEDPQFQVSATGNGTLQNIIAIAKAKLQNKELRTKDGAELPQFSLTKTRERTLVTNVSVPLGLWLARDVKGVKTQVSNEDFLDSLKQRMEACDICIDISQSDSEIEQKTEEFAVKRVWAKNMTNTYVIAAVIESLENPKEFAAGLQWEMTHPKESALLAESHPELDTPAKKWEHIQNEPVKKELNVPEMTI